MGEKSLGWGLRLMGVAFFIGPILACLAVYNWNPPATLTPSPDPFETLFKLREGVFGVANLELVDYRIVENTIELTMRFTSPIDHVLVINEITYKVMCSLESPPTYLTVMELKEAVTVQPRSAVNMILIGDFTRALDHYIEFHIGEGQMTLNFENFDIRVYGITIKTGVGWQNIQIPIPQVER